MIEIFHSTSDLGKILRKGLKSIYQLGLDREGNSDLYLSPEEIDKPDTPRITRFLYKSLFFFDRRPAGDKWVSILVDETDETIKVGNINLVDSPYQPGRFYEKSLMTLPTYLSRRNQPSKNGEDFENPFTAKMMDYNQKDKFEQRWGERLERLLQNKPMFSYSAEILVPRLIITPAEFHRNSGE